MVSASVRFVKRWKMYGRTEWVPDSRLDGRIGRYRGRSNEAERVTSEVKTMFYSCSR